MRNKLDFAEHSRLLGGALFADKVILALFRFSQIQKLGNQERDDLEKAKEFLDEVIEGGSLSTGVFQSARDITAAKAFTHAADSVTIPLSSKSDFLQYIQVLRSTISEILENKPVTNDHLTQVDAFFSRYAQMQFEQSRSMLEAV